jgi:hypothetical protein
MVRTEPGLITLPRAVISSPLPAARIFTDRDPAAGRLIDGKPKGDLGPSLRLSPAVIRYVSIGLLVVI